MDQPQEHSDLEWQQLYLRLDRIEVRLSGVEVQLARASGGWRALVALSTFFGLILGVMAQFFGSYWRR